MTKPPHAPHAPPTATNYLHTILQTQQSTLHEFLSLPSTRTPTILLYIATFGGSLHSAVTTYFYLAIGASDMDIGRLGFIMSMGALIGSPVVGYSLDRWGVWVPMSVTSLCCSGGCLWRGVARGLGELRLGAILLGIGINLWTVVLAHLVKSFPPHMRSQVLSGYAVQMTILQLCGKGIFPLLEYVLHHGLHIDNVLLRYRIHMGLCTLFCVYGTAALFWDKENVIVIQKKSNATAAAAAAAVSLKKYQQKHSDVVEDNENYASHAPAEKNHLAYDSRETSTTQQSSSSLLLSDELSHSQILPSSSLSSCNEIELPEVVKDSSFLNEHPHLHQSKQQQQQQQQLKTQSPPPPMNNSSFNNEINLKSTAITNISTNTINKQQQQQQQQQQQRRQLITTLTLTIALLLQSISTTTLTVLWPLLAHDKFHLSAHTFGILTFASSVVSTMSVAAFPIVERMKSVGGSMRCAALGFGVGAVSCVLFCVCSFGSFGDSGTSRIIGRDGDFLIGELGGGATVVGMGIVEDMGAVVDGGDVDRDDRFLQELVSGLEDSSSADYIDTLSFLEEHDHERKGVLFRYQFQQRSPPRVHQSRQQTEWRQHTEFVQRNILRTNITSVEYNLGNESNQENIKLPRDTIRRNQKKNNPKHDASKSIQSRNHLVWHAISAIAFQASLCFLEPSLKSIFSLVVTTSSLSSPPSPFLSNAKSSNSSLGFTMGFMTTLGSIGGMVGNLGGTWLYTLSKDTTKGLDATNDGGNDVPNNSSDNGWSSISRGGALPFVVTAILLAISAIMIWRLDEPIHEEHQLVRRLGDEHNMSEEVSGTVRHHLPGTLNGTDPDLEHGKPESIDDSDTEIHDGCCLALRETTYDLKLD